MFKHTIASANIIKSELSLLSYLVNIVSSVFLIGYMIFATVIGRGFLAVNITLCVLTAVNFTVYLITRGKRDREAKSIRKFVKHFYNISRIILNAIPLGSVLYLLAFTSEDVSRIEMVFIPLLIILWIAQVIFEISSLYIESRMTLFVDGLRMDIEPFMKIKNVISGESEKNLKSSVSDAHRALLTEEAEKYIAEKEEREEEERATPKDSIVKRIANTASIIKDYIKK